MALIRDITENGLKSEGNVVHAIASGLSYVRLGVLLYIVRRRYFPVLRPG